MKRIFQGHQISVMERASESKTTIIGFQSWTPMESFDNESLTILPNEFQYLSETDWHLIIFRQNGNHWYEVDEMRPAILATKRALQNRTTFTVGRSMGGYAAIAYSPDFSARAFSMAATYSLDERIAPFERRWQHNAKCVRFTHDRILEKGHLIHGVHFFDPFHELDAQHARLIDRATMVESIACPFAGHAVDQHLDSTFGLLIALQHFTTGRFEKRSFNNARRKCRANDNGYFVNLALAFFKRGSTERALFALEKFVSLDRLDSRDVRALCGALTTAGLVARADELFLLNARTPPRHSYDLYNMAIAAQVLGRERDFQELIALGHIKYPNDQLIHSLSTYRR